MALFLGIDPGRLDEIYSFTGIDVWTQIVQEWFEKYPMSDSDRWEQLVRVLLQPAVNEPAVAEILRPYLGSMESIFSDTSFRAPHSPEYNKFYIGE